MATQQIRTIEAHVGGQPVRLIVEGLPRPAGRTIQDRRDWLATEGDHLRRALVRPPRGHADACVAALVESDAPGAHAGLLCMDVDGVPALLGHAVIAVTTIALERQLLFFRDSGPQTRITFDTPAGLIHADARLDARGGRTRVDAVSCSGLAAFVHTAGHPVRVGSRELRVDLAVAGRLHAIADSEAIGIPLVPARLHDLHRLAAELLQTLSGTFATPTGEALTVDAVIFTGAASDPESHLRSVTMTRGGSVDWSPGVTGTMAVMSVLDAMGLLPDGHVFVHEGLSGALLRGRGVDRRLAGDVPALIAEVTGAAWIIGEQTFLLDDDDPFREGLPL